MNYNLESSEILLNETFQKSQLPYINSYVKSLIETEDFSQFSRYTQSLVREYFQSFLNKLVAQIWLYFSANEHRPEIFFAPMTVVMSFQLSKLKKNLLEKNMLHDIMSEQEMRRKLNSFLSEHEDRAEFHKTKTSYLGLRHDFDNIAELAKSYQSCGQEMISSVKYLLELYLRYKEAIFKGMGFDVILEFYSVDNFNFIYRDERLQNPEARQEYEKIAMNAALKAAMPGFDGDIAEFAKIGN